MLMDVHESKLGNRVRIISAPMPHVESASIGIWVGVGARHESNRQAGISHFIEHMLFKGTKKRSASDISRDIEGHGGYLNAFTQEENTCYYAHVPYDHFDRTLDVLSDMYLNPRLDEADIAKEKGVVIEEIMMYRDQPQHMVQEMLGEALWKKHPIGRPISGSPETVKSMTRTDILTYKSDKYVTDNTVFAFAGKLDHEACVRKVEKYVAGLRSKTRPGCVLVTAGVSQDAVALKAKEIEQAHLAIGVRLPFGAEDKRRYVLRVLNVVLGENMSSRLFQVVREKYGLAYYVSSSFQLLRETGALVISAGLDRKRRGKAVDLIVGEVEKMKKQPVTQAELRRAKDYIVGQIRLGLESTRHQMLWIGDNMMAHGRFVPPENVIKAVSAVTAADLQRLARSILKCGWTSLAMIAPGLSKDDEAGFRKSLATL
jgi:predicted Zn-dependent peptidase